MSKKNTKTSAPEIDEESQRLIDEMSTPGTDVIETPDVDEAAAAEAAKALIRDDLNDAALASVASLGNTVTNMGDNYRRIKTVELAPGESYTLTPADLGNDLLMAKIDRAVFLGVLARS